MEPELSTRRSPSASRPSVEDWLAAPLVERCSAPPRVLLEARELTFRYGDCIALKSVSTALHTNSITAFIGPSGCGKSTLLRVFNRMHDGYPQGDTRRPPTGCKTGPSRGSAVKARRAVLTKVASVWSRAVP